jgi:hypothetical protein
MTTVLIDRIAGATLHNGLVRIECMAIGPDGAETPSAALLLPSGQAGAILQDLVVKLQDLDRRVRERAGAEPG